MTYRGIVKGKTIELENRLPYADGQPVAVSVQPLASDSQPGSAMVIRQTMHEPPHLTWEDVETLERVIGEGKIPVHQGGVFDKG